MVLNGDKKIKLGTKREGYQKCLKRISNLLVYSLWE
jgi:hypothetical protein